MHAAVKPNAPSVPLSKAAGSHTFVPTEIPTNMGAEVAGMGFPLADSTSFPPTMVAPSLPPKNYLTLHDKRFACREWMDQTRQVGSSYLPRAFHSSQPPFIPYHVSEGRIIAPTQMQRGMMDMRQAMYLDSEAYRDDIYRENARGDPHGPYGGFYPRADSAIYLDAVWGIRANLHGPRHQSSVALSDTQQALGMRHTPHPVPGPSHHPSAHLDVQ